MIGRLRDLLPLRLSLELGGPGPAPLPPPHPGFGEGIERTYVLEDVPLVAPRPLRPVPEDVDVYRLAPELRGRVDPYQRLLMLQDPYRLCVRVGSLAERQGYREVRAVERPGGAWGVVFWRPGGGHEAGDHHVYGEGETRAAAYLDAVRQIYGWPDVHVDPRGDGDPNEDDWSLADLSRGGGAQNEPTVSRGEE